MSTSAAASRAASLLSLRSLPRANCRHRAPRIPSSHSAAAHALPGARRQKHTLVPLRYDTDQPLGKFWSAEQLRVVAVEYQQGLLDRLNEEIKGTEWENKGVVETVVETAGQREHALIFNYASQAMNNSFFLDTLTPQDQHSLHELSQSLQTSLDKQYGSIHQFISYMSAAALGMVGSGWVWLAIDRQNRLAVVPTYGAGTMLVRERQQVSPFGEGREMPLLGGEGRGSLGQVPRGYRAPNPGELATLSTLGLGQTEPNLQVDTIGFKWFGADMNPIFCISVHEHAWLHDYGVWGKEEYLKRYWTVLDWAKVSRYFEKWAEHNYHTWQSKEAGSRRR